MAERLRRSKTKAYLEYSEKIPQQIAEAPEISAALRRFSSA